MGPSIRHRCIEEKGNYAINYLIRASSCACVTDFNVSQILKIDQTSFNHVTFLSANQQFTSFQNLNHVQPRQ
ncbi:hypothetical protein RCL_jg9542.t1 [Rhizophagus clarus]|uniref:Uncharacterized protein n=1 Tax=Rhizophagus clarus TaxID=94130 RepID=A0A8H3LC94_9GLOM|nr:hypothetical protein RCL_jg9542.t1 [Rhizophagus clarus]